eukprot:jgi/Bigna1/145196/aug1.96_g19904
MPTDVCLKLDEIAKKGGGIKQGWQESSERRTFDSHINRGYSFLQNSNVTSARNEFGYAAAIAYIDGDAEMRVRAYTKLAQAQLLGQYSGVPKMSRDREEGDRPLDVQAAAMGYYKLEDLLRVSGRHGEADALPMELSEIHKAVSADPELKNLAHSALRLIT